MEDDILIPFMCSFPCHLSTSWCFRWVLLEWVGESIFHASWRLAGRKYAHFLEPSFFELHLACAPLGYFFKKLALTTNYAFPLPSRFQVILSILQVHLQGCLIHDVLLDLSSKKSALPGHLFMYDFCFPSVPCPSPLLAFGPFHLSHLPCAGLSGINRSMVTHLLNLSFLFCTSLQRCFDPEMTLKCMNIFPSS